MRPNCDVQRNEAPGFAHSSRLEKNQHKGTESSKASSSCLGSSLLGGRLLRRCGLLGSSSLLGGSLGLGISLWCGGGGGLGLGDTSGLCLAEDTGYLSLDGISGRGGGSSSSSLAGLAGVCLGLSSRGSLLGSGLCRCGLLLSCLLGGRGLLGRCLGLLIYSSAGKVDCCGGKTYGGGGLGLRGSLGLGGSGLLLGRLLLGRLLLGLGLSLLLLGSSSRLSELHSS
jgi:hypothetical protein